MSFTLWKIVRCSVILLLPLFSIVMLYYCRVYQVLQEGYWSRIAEKNYGVHEYIFACITNHRKEEHEARASNKK